MLVIGQCNRTVKGQLTCRACVSGQNTSRMCAVVSHFIELTVFFLFFFKWKHIIGLVSFSNFVIVLINW